MNLILTDPFEGKYQFLINKRKSTSLKYLDDSTFFIENSNDKNKILKNIEEYNPNKNRKILVVVDNMIADMLKIKNLIQ